MDRGNDALAQLARAGGTPRPAPQASTPHRPRPGALAVTGWVAAGLGVALLLSVMAVGVLRGGWDKPATAAAAPEWDTSAEAQAVRHGILNVARDGGLIDKVNHPGGDLPHVWVKPRFYAMPYADKVALCETVYMIQWERKRPGQVVVLRDWRSGREVGTYSTTSGLEMQ